MLHGSKSAARHEEQEEALRAEPASEAAEAVPERGGGIWAELAGRPAQKRVT